MTDLVTGAAGFVGVHLVEALEAAGHGVVSASRSMGDGREVGALCELIAGGGFERVFHLAALSRTGVAEADPGRAMRVNRDWSGELAAAARAAGAGFVYASTDLVFGGAAPGDLGFGIGDQVRPVGVYGTSKAAGEAAVLGAAPGALVVRLPLLFGDSRGRGLGASDALFATLGRGEAPMLFTDERRTALDVAAVAKCLVVLAGARASGVQHLAGRALNRLELGLALCRAAGVDASGVRAGTRADCGLEETRAADTCLDASETLAAYPQLADLMEAGRAPE